MHANNVLVRSVNVYYVRLKLPPTRLTRLHQSMVDNGDNRVKLAIFMWSVN